MICVDIETSGADNYIKNGIWQIGAIDLETKEEFLEEARIDDTDTLTEMALLVCEKTEEELRDKNKQSQKEMLEKFFNWCKKTKVKNFICQNPQFDYAFFRIRAAMYDLVLPLHWRAFDLHSIAQAKHSEKEGGAFLKDYDGQLMSGMGLPKICEFCGMKDPRKNLDKDGKVIAEGIPHNGLFDAKLEAECFSRLMFGKNLLPEYNKFPIPDYLKK